MYLSAGHIDTHVAHTPSRNQGAYTFGGGSSGSAAGPDGDITGGGDTTGMSSAGGASIEAWAPTMEQKHNLQLLELIVKLREALLGIPALVTPPTAPQAGSSSSAFGVGGAAAAVAEGGMVGGDTAAAAATASPETTVLAAECRAQVAEGVKALDETATRVFLEPYLCGVARALEDIVSKMHRYIN